MQNCPTHLFFLESPYRVIESLDDIHSTLGDRQICVAREMTKMFEEYWRGTVSGALEYFNSQTARGEFTLVIEGKKKDSNERWTEQEMLKAIRNELKSGRSAKDISSELSMQSGWSKKEIYTLVNLNK